MFRKKSSNTKSDTKSGDDTIIEWIPAPFYQLGFSQYIDILTLSNDTMFFNPLKAMGRIRHLYIQTLTLCF